MKVLLIKGKSKHLMDQKDYESPKKFKNGLTQKEILAKNGYKQATEEQTNKIYNIVDEPKEIKKENKKIKKVEIPLDVIQADNQDQGEGHE